MHNCDLQKEDPDSVVHCLYWFAANNKPGKLELEIDKSSNVVETLHKIELSMMDLYCKYIRDDTILPSKRIYCP